MNFMKTQFNPKKHTIYNPINKDKYVGSYPLIVRSSWERTFCQWCDNNSSIIKWNSEDVIIPYYDPVKRKQRRYFPDFMIKVRDKNDDDKIYIVEVKPYNQVMAPKGSKNKKQKTIISENAIYATNNAKWKAAADFCRKRGFIFKIITEKELYK